MLKTRRARLSCLVAAAGLAVLAVRPSLVVADADAVPAVPAVAVPIGGETHVSLSFAAPAVVATDFGVLFDGTGSQSEHLANFGRMLTASVDAAAVGNPSVRVGVSTSGDVPVFPFGTATDMPYRLKSQLTADRLVWAPALEALQAVEGGGDDQEGQFPAILELLNSASEDPIHRSMAYDPAARRLLIVSADSAPHIASDKFCENEICTPYPGPTAATVRAMLDQAGVTVIVLARGDVGVLSSIATASGGSVIDATVPEAAASLSTAIEIAPVVIRPTLTGCEGLQVRVEKLVRAKPGETVSVPLVFRALPGATEGTRTCGLAFSGVAQSVSITVAKPCESTPTSAAATTTTTLTAPTTVVDPVTTVAGGASTTAPAATTTTPAVTTTAPGVTTTTTTTTTPDVTTTTTPAVTTTTTPAVTTTTMPAVTTTTTPAVTTIEPSSTVAPTEATTTVVAPTPAAAAPVVQSESSTSIPSPSSVDLRTPPATVAAEPTTVPIKVVPTSLLAVVPPESTTTTTTTVAAPAPSGPCLPVTTTVVPSTTVVVSTTPTITNPAPVAPVPEVSPAPAPPELVLPAPTLIVEEAKPS